MALWYGTPARLSDGSWGVRVKDTSLQVGRRLEIQVTTQEGRKWTDHYYVAHTDKFGALCEKEATRKKR